MKSRTRSVALSILSGLLAVCCGGGQKAAYPDLFSADAGVRTDAAVRLGEAKDRQAVPALLKALEDPEESVRVEAARALGAIGDRSATGPLGKLAADPLDTVRMAAAQAFRMLEDPAAVPALERLLADPDEGVRKAALRAAGTIPGPEAVRLLVNSALHDEVEEVREVAVKLLAGRRAAEAIPFIERALETESDLLRATAADALREMGDRSSVPALLKALDDPYFKVRSLSAHALAKIAPSDADVRRALARRLEAESEELTRVDLAWALAKTGDRSAMGIIRDLLLEGEFPEVRAEAALALGEVGEASDRELLAVAARDKKGLVRQEASRSLEKIGQAAAPAATSQAHSPGEGGVAGPNP